MRKQPFVFAASLAFTLGLSAQSVPTTVNYQGRLTDNTPAQTPLDASVPMRFSIWDDASAGTNLWQEPASGGLNIPVSQGIFNIALGGNGVPLPSSLFSGASSTRYLEITLNPGAGNEEILTPRQLISATGYAARAQKAADSEALGGLAPSSWQRALAAPVCSAGQYLSALQPDGSSSCSTPAGTVYSAGAGLGLSGNQFSVTAPLPINLGGTGATTQPFVDLTTNQTAGGIKRFSSRIESDGGLVAGSAYAGVNAPPTNGAIIQGNTGIGIATPNHRLHVAGDFRLEGDFINQEITGTHANALQSVPFTNGIFNPINGSVVSITIPDGNGANNSGVLVMGGARVFGGTLNGGSSSMGGFYLILQRALDAAFTVGLTNLTYQSGNCYIKTPNGAGAAAIGYGDGTTIFYTDLALTANATYYYRLALYPNGVSITSGTYDVYERDMAILQIKR